MNDRRWNFIEGKAIEIYGLAVSGPDRLVSSRTFVSADVGNVLLVHEGSGFERAHYVIQAVEDGAAIVQCLYASSNAKNGVATLGQ